MSAPVSDPQLDYLVYTLPEIRQAMWDLGNQAKTQLNSLMLFYLAAKQTYGRPYLQYGPIDQRVQPHGVPVMDSRFKDPAFKRANTLRVLSRWQSFRAGLGFRARKLSEQQLLDRLERNKLDRRDGAFVKLAKTFRGRAIQSVLDSRSNIDRSRLRWMKAKQDKQFEKANRSYRHLLRLYLQIRPRAKELAETRDACYSALQSIAELEKEGITHLAIDPKAGFRRLLVGGAKLPYSAVGALEEINKYLAEDARKSALRLGNAVLGTIQPPPDPPNTAAAQRPKRNREPMSAMAPQN